MVHFARLAILAAIATWIVFSIADALSLRIEYFSFFAGLGAAAIAEIIRFTIANWWSRMTEPYKPQMVKLPTKETPDQISSAASVAGLLGALFFAGLAFGIERLTNPSPLSLNSFIIPFVTGLVALVLLPVLAKTTGGKRSKAKPKEAD